MPILHAIILGLVQGFSEFLPISSSGHLALVPWLFGWNDFADVTNGASIEKAFDTALHLGTLVAVLFYLRTELIGYVREGIRIVVSPQRANRQMGKRAWLIVASAIPAGIAGAMVGDEATLQSERARLAASSASMAEASAEELRDSLRSTVSVPLRSAGIALSVGVSALAD